MAPRQAKATKRSKEIETALIDPSGVFDRPEAVLSRNDIDHETKIEILRRWEYDAREMQVAEEENMAGGESDLLDRVLKALKTLQAPDAEKEAPTKHGGT
ncbi:MAG: hypothetical protein ACREDZ_11840 [Kiloniellales bacterium]